MKFSGSIWNAIGCFVVWMALAWFAGGWAGVKSASLLWCLRGGVWFIGVAGCVGFLMLRRHERPEQENFGDPAEEIEDAFAEATERLRTAKGIKLMNSLPAVCFLGDRGSAKTSCIANSRIRPELLTEETESEVEGRTLSVWYSRQSIFIDPAGSVMANAKARKKLFKKFKPARKPAVAGASAPTRSAVVVVDCDWFLKPKAASALPRKARQYRQILSEMAHELGGSVPVYVVFSKADKIPCFREFFEHLSEAEAGEVLGVSLPMYEEEARGEYGQRQRQRINDAFQTIRQSLIDRRPAYLARACDAARISSAYEFPREFQKLRPRLVEFLTDLCRPGRASKTSFLRGFYLAGARGTDSSEVRRWIFMKDLLRDVFLADAAGSTVAPGHSGAGWGERMAMAAASVASLAVAGCLSVSYNANSNLLRNAMEISQSVSWMELTPGQQVSKGTLRNLSEIRETMAELDSFEKRGAPWNYRVLYRGSAIREPLRVTYYALFRRALLEPAQQTLVAICTNPDAYEEQGYGYVYDALKSYLITTSHHEMSNPEFLTSTLTRHWWNKQPVDPEQENLVRANFEFYSKELAAANPYPQYDRPDATAVENARTYLSEFVQDEDLVTGGAALVKTAERVGSRHP